MRGLALMLFLALALTSCNQLWDSCENKCYAQKTNEPRDFDDCVRRCKK